MQDGYQLGALLVERGLIDVDQLSGALAQQRSDHAQLGQVLVSQGLVSQDQLQGTLELQRWLRMTALAVSLGMSTAATAVAASNSDSVKISFRKPLPEEQVKQQGPTLLQKQAAAQRLAARRSAFAKQLANPSVTSTSSPNCQPSSIYATLPQRCDNLTASRVD